MLRESLPCSGCSRLEREVNALRDTVRAQQAQIDELCSFDAKLDAMMEEIRALPGGSDYLQAEGRWLTTACTEAGSVKPETTDATSSLRASDEPAIMSTSATSNDETGAT